MNYSDIRYNRAQLQKVIDSAEKDNTYKPTLIVSHEGTKTKTLNVSLTQLKAIQQILMTDDSIL